MRVIGTKNLEFWLSGMHTNSYFVVGIDAQRYILKIVFALSRNFWDAPWLDHIKELPL